MAQANRSAVLDAATAVFAERGWSAGVREIASAAGVSVETIYSHFGSKANLLNQVLDVAVVGDDEPVALMDRPEFAALSSGSHRQRAAAAAALNTAVNSRTSGLQQALREAATQDAALAARLVEMLGRQRLTVHIGGAMVAGRELAAAEADGLWSVLSQEVYGLLIDRAGWTPAQYEAWLTETILRLLRLDD